MKVKNPADRNESEKLANVYEAVTAELACLAHYNRQFKKYVSLDMGLITNKELLTTEAEVPVGIPYCNLVVKIR